MMKIYQQHLVLKPTTSLHPLFIRTFLTVLLIILKQIIRFNYVFSIYCSLMHRPFKEVDTCVIEYIPMFWNFYFRLTTPYGSFQKLPQVTIFHVSRAGYWLQFSTSNNSTSLFDHWLLYRHCAKLNSGTSDVQSIGNQILQRMCQNYNVVSWVSQKVY